VFGVYHGEPISAFYILCVINDLLTKKYLEDHFLFGIRLVSLQSSDMFLDLELNMVRCTLYWVGIFCLDVRDMVSKL